MKEIIKSALSKGGCDSALAPLCPQQWWKMRTQTKVSLHKGAASATGTLPPAPFQQGETLRATGVPKAFLTSTPSLRLRASRCFGPLPPTPSSRREAAFQSQSASWHLLNHIFLIAPSTEWIHLQGCRCDRETENTGPGLLTIVRGMLDFWPSGNKP